MIPEGGVVSMGFGLLLAQSIQMIMIRESVGKPVSKTVIRPGSSRMALAVLGWPGDNSVRSSSAEQAGIPDLFKRRMTSKVKQAVARRMREAAWCDAGEGWQAAETMLRLSGWSRARRVPSCCADASRSTWPSSTGAIPSTCA
jgi:hypothetical protein